MARIARTYSKLTKRIAVNELEPAPKRRRVSAVDTGEHESSRPARRRSSPASSSPPPALAPVLSSDGPAECSSPPSSPPPTSPSASSLKVRKPAFSLMRRKRLVSGASSRRILGELSNVKSGKRSLPSGGSKPMQQMQIDLGGDIRKTCKTCGMDYIPSSAEDVALHKSFHAMNVGGVKIGRALLSSMTKARVKSSGADDSGGQEAIFVVDRKSAVGEKRLARRVLDVVNTELSAVDIEDDSLWSQVSLGPRAGSSDAGTALDHHGKSDRFRCFLYVQGDRCVGMCLAERISEAHLVLPEAERGQNRVSPEETLEKKAGTVKSSSVSVSEQSTPSILGVSRIWTSQSHRRRGIASRLLESAMDNFIYGMRIPKEQVAFSQPTESGGRLAQSWFEGMGGWHVYRLE